MIEEQVSIGLLKLMELVPLKKEYIKAIFIR